MNGPHYIFSGRPAHKRKRTPAEDVAETEPQFPVLAGVLPSQAQPPTGILREKVLRVMQPTPIRPLPRYSPATSSETIRSLKPSPSWEDASAPLLESIEQELEKHRQRLEKIFADSGYSPFRPSTPFPTSARDRLSPQQVHPAPHVRQPQRHLPLPRPHQPHSIPTLHNPASEASPISKLLVEPLDCDKILLSCSLVLHHGISARCRDCGFRLSIKCETCHPTPPAFSSSPLHGRGIHSRFRSPRLATRAPAPFPGLPATPGYSQRPPSPRASLRATISPVDHPAYHSRRQDWSRFWYRSDSSPSPIPQHPPTPYLQPVPLSYCTYYPESRNSNVNLPPASCYVKSTAPRNHKSHPEFPWEPYYSHMQVEPSTPFNPEQVAGDEESPFRSSPFKQATPDNCDSTAGVSKGSPSKSQASASESDDSPSSAQPEPLSPTQIGADLAVFLGAHLK